MLDRSRRSTGSCPPACFLAQAQGVKNAWWENLLRQACISPHLINGGGGCASQIKELDRKLRTSALRAMQAMEQLHPGRSEQIRSLTVEQAINVLMEARHVSETARHHAGNHMVRHDNTQAGVYNHARSFAMPTVDQRRALNPTPHTLHPQPSTLNFRTYTLNPIP